VAGMATGASIGNVHQGLVTTGRVALGMWREIVRMGLCGRHGLWHLARWAVRYLVFGLHDRQYGRWVMRERLHRVRLVLVCRVLACRMRCKGTLGQVRCVGRGRCGPCGIRGALRPWCAVSCLCRISSRTKLRGGEGRDKGRFVSSGGWVDLCSRNLLTIAGWACGLVGPGPWGWASGVVVLDY
jgi:hypothetical protein